MPDKQGRATVVIAEPDATAGDAAEGALNGDQLMTVLRTVAERRQLLASVASFAPDIVVADVTLDGEIGGTVKDVIQRQPNATVLVTGPANMSTAISRAVIAGARGFVMKPYRPDELVVAVRDAHANQRLLQQSMRSERAAPTGTTGALIVVYSAKGGVGTTTIATHLAVALRQKTNSNVALVDLDLQFGDVGVVLDLQSPNTISDLLALDQIDQPAIDEVFVKHQSGLRVLLAPESVSAAQDIDADRVLRMLSELRQHFAYVVCDTWHPLDDVTLAALSAADRVVLVTTPDIPSLRNLRRVMTDKETLELERRSIILVNRYSTRFGLQLPEIESAIGKSVGMTMGSEGMAITQAINTGQTLSGRIGEAFGSLADLVIKEVGPRHMLMPQLAAVAGT